MPEVLSPASEAAWYLPGLSGDCMEYAQRGSRIGISSSQK